MIRERVSSQDSKKSRPPIKRRDSSSRAHQPFHTEIVEIEASGPFCMLPSHFFERSLALAKSSSDHQPGIVFEDLRLRSK